MKLDWRSIWKAMGLGMLLSAAGSAFFFIVWIRPIEAAFNVVLGATIGFLFGYVSVRNGGDDRFTPMAVGGALSAVLPAALAWTSSLVWNIDPDTGERIFLMLGILSGPLLGGVAGVVGGLVGGLLYASKF